MKFWAQDRADREARIAANKVQTRSLMTDEQKNENDAAAMAETERDAAEEQERERSSRKM